MIRSGDKIRLTDAERKRLTALTGTDPKDVTSVEGLNNFIKFHEGMHAGENLEAKLLRLLLQDEMVK